MKKKVTINYLKEPEIAHLITPDLISKLGSITFPASSFPFEISKVARIIAISVNNDASASSFPGHILNRKRKGGKNVLVMWERERISDRPLPLSDVVFPEEKKNNYTNFPSQ